MPATGTASCRGAPHANAGVRRVHGNTPGDPVPTLRSPGLPGLSEAAGNLVVNASPQRQRRRTG
jgi:hypothetical protein